MYSLPSGRPSRAIFKSEPMGNSADSYNLTWKIDSYAPIEEYKLMFRKLFVSFENFIISFNFRLLAEGQCIFIYYLYY